MMHAIITVLLKLSKLYNEDLLDKIPIHFVQTFVVPEL